MNGRHADAFLSRTQILTCRRERNWLRLAAAVERAHRDFAAHVQKAEAEVLPLLQRGLPMVGSFVLPVQRREGRQGGAGL